MQLLMREISHRSKNLLAVVQAIAGQTAHSAGTLDEFEERFIKRLQGLAASHDLLVHENWRGVRMFELAREQLGPFAEANSSRLTLQGPAVMLTAEAAQAIGLALHELATNATKYGAWMTPVGHVTFSWTKEADGDVELTWLERGGPRVLAPTKKGFGHVVIEKMVALSVNGGVTMTFEPDGLRWVLFVPGTNLAALP